MANMMLTPVERVILLHLLNEGDDLAANIGSTDDDEKPHPQSVTRSFGNLEGNGMVINKGNGVYTLTPDGYRRAQIIRNSTGIDSDDSV